MFKALFALFHKLAYFLFKIIFGLFLLLVIWALSLLCWD